MITSGLNVKEELKERIVDILQNLGDGDISTSAYDTAWVARIKNPDDPTKPLFPKSLEWVINNQNKDGSWGFEDIEYFHDRIICTLSCIVALKSYAIEEVRFNSGLNYLNKNLENLPKDHHETLGFELIFTSLLKTAQRLGIDIEYGSKIIQKYNEMRDLKLSKIPLDMVQNMKSSIAYSLEFLDEVEGIDISKLKIHKEKNGSIGCSPAATAFYYMHTQDKDSFDYLDNLTKKLNGGVPNVYSIDTFEKAWITDLLIDLDLADEFDEEIKKIVDDLDEIWEENPEGISFSSNFRVAELDSTAVVYRVLNNYGKIKNPEIFDIFLNNNIFLCYKGQKEANPSYLANLIKALKVCSDTFAKKNEYLQIAEKQLSEYSTEGYFDKWHISPIYTYSRINYKDKNTSKENVIDFMKKSKSQDSWGYYRGTLEETALIIITKYLNNDLINSKEEFSHYLDNFIDSMEKINSKNIEYLWIGKALYSPFNVVKAYIFASMLLLLKT